MHDMARRVFHCERVARHDAPARRGVVASRTRAAYPAAVMPFRMANFTSEGRSLMPSFCISRPR